MKIDRIVMLGLLTVATATLVVSLAASGGAQTNPNKAPLPPMGGAKPPAGTPPGHPPTGGAPMPSMPTAPAPAPAQSLTWTVPSSWVNEKPSSGMRKAQYRIPGKSGAAECVVFYFGPGDGGDTKSNVERWKGQFLNADAKSREFKVGDIPVTFVEVSGTYTGGMGAAAGEKPNSMLLGAIAKGPDANWFFRAVGPKPTLEGARGDFEKMIRSLKRGS